MGVRLDEKIGALVLSVIVSVSAVGIVFFLTTGYASEYSWTREVPDDQRPHYRIYISGLTDCIVDISIADNPNLFFSITVELDKPARVDTNPEAPLVEDLFFYEYDRTDYYSIHLGNHVGSDAKIKYCNLTIGNSIPIDIGVEGADTSITAVYDNDAQLEDVGFQCGGDNTTVDLTITEDVVYLGFGFDIYLDTSSVNLDLDLQIGISGTLIITCPGSYQVTTYGWDTVIVSGDSRTLMSDGGPATPKLLDGTILTDEITAVLRD